VHTELRMFGMWQTLIIILVTFIIIIGAAVVTTMLTSSDSDNYLQERATILSREESTFYGHNVNLTAKEILVNKILLKEKTEELIVGYKNSSNFLPSVHFFQAKDRIDKSPVFAIIKKMPKAMSLHTHLLAGVSADFLIKEISYRDNLYGGYFRDTFKLKFLADPQDDDRCNWTLISDMRLNQTAPVFDIWLREQLLLNVENPNDAYPSAESVWGKFKKIFTTVYDLLSYKPVFQEYIYKLLQELYDDNVMYTELRGTMMPLYELDGRTYSNQQFFEIFIETVNKFKAKHPRFIGVRYIHSIYRGVNEDVLRTGLDDIIKMKQLFPDFISGFDFVGFESEGKSIVDYRAQLLEAKKHLKFFFHAGETNWFGHVDLNLLDAILLNATRIGHGFAAVKHPALLKLGKERNIPFEICPISNQVLMLNEDPKNHPAAILMAIDYPLVICNDDPSIWNATGLSYDWYVAFMAMTPKTSGIEVLKQFAINSIVYSAMEAQEKKRAMEQWKTQWSEFLDNVLSEKSD
jgi:adenosine deaminase CECR1